MFKKHSLVSSRNGFTLMELLIVVAIIGVLAAVIIFSLKDAKSKGLDARRLTDMRSLAEAVNLYQNNHNNDFPPADPVDATGWATSYGNATTFMNNLVTDGDMPALIIDPINSTQYQAYYYRPGADSACPTDTKAVLMFYMSTVAQEPYVACGPYPEPTTKSPDGTYSWCSCLR